MNNDFVNEINCINKSIMKCNVSLKNYNTMKLDGVCKYFIKPTTFMEMKKVMKVIKMYNINYIVIGNGSNIIFTDKIKECIIKLDFHKSVHINVFMANELLMVKANEFYNRGYKGLEYISNIPASIGGAIIMNAGAYYHSFSDIVEYVYYLDEYLNFKTVSKENCDFKYRDSFFKGKKIIVLGCKVMLVKSDKQVIKNIMNECKERRIKSQPLQYPNSGSIFKNKENINAWKLIEGVNLKGYRINGAKISDKHSNFIINYDNAKAIDIILLIELIKKKVKAKFDVILEEEVIIID